MKLVQSFFLLAALCSFAVLVGCGGGSSYEFGVVNGKVTLDGQPLGNVEVTFEPEEGPLASGEADASGNFTVMSATGDAGAVVGDHKVMVRPNMMGGVGGSSDSGTEATGEVLEIPAKYQDIVETDLTATVSAGDNNITLELKSK